MRRLLVTMLSRIIRISDWGDGEEEWEGGQEPEKAFSSRKMCLILKYASISVKRVLGQGASLTGLRSLYSLARLFRHTLSSKSVFAFLRVRDAFSGGRRCQIACDECEWNVSVMKPNRLFCCQQ